MLTLHARVVETAPAHLDITLDLSQDGLPVHHAEVSFSMPTDEGLLEGLRWLMEDSLTDGTAARKVRADDIRRRLATEGARLFDAVFHADDIASALWAYVAGRLRDTRIEVAAELSTLSLLPWELMRDPETGSPLCLAARQFVRLKLQAFVPAVPRATARCRVLLITSRPSGQDDVAYRSIAMKVFRELTQMAEYDVTFLRPPTFAECARTLRDAHAEGLPFDIVHFDGHGFYTAAEETATQPVAGSYILFEGEGGQNHRAVSGRDFANLLAETGCQHVVLNACRSAHVGGSDANNALSSFSDELVRRGAHVVVSMRYNVYVASALRFIGEFYRQLGRGQSLVSAASLASKNLATDPARDGIDTFDLDDWLVPVILQGGDDLTITRSPNPPLTNAVQAHDALLASAIPPPPDIGFVGADDTLLSIDRAFDQANAILLYGLAGAGKTACAAEFARWYSMTKGHSGEFLFTLFQEHTTVDQLVAELEPLVIRRAGVQWRNLNREERLRLAPALISRGSLLWIWDNVEAFHSAPAAAVAEMTTFLRSAVAEGAKFIITSRSRELELFGNLPVRVEMAPLRASESFDFASRMVLRMDRRHLAGGALWPIIEYCEGNPLTLAVAFSTFLITGRAATEDEALTVVRDLRSGEPRLNDDEAEGQSRSLRASLNAGLQSLTHRVLRKIALLHLFRSYVNTNVLLGMCSELREGAVIAPDYEGGWHLAELSQGDPAAWDQALGRAAEVGLLRRTLPQHYWLHPAIQLALRTVFRRAYPQQADFERAGRAFAESLGLFGIHFTTAWAHGVREKALRAMADEEANFLHALSLSRVHRWRQAEIGLLHGLFALYWHTGRRTEWATLLEESLPAFIDPNGLPLIGTERWWTFLVDHIARLAMWRREFGRAEELARVVLQRERAATGAMIYPADGSMTELQKKQIQSLGIALGRLADIVRELGDPDCLALNEEALTVYRSIEDRVGISVRLFNLGHTFKNIASL